MSTKTRPWEQIDVRTMGEAAKTEAPEPFAFLWRGRLYIVREVIGTWTEPHMDGATVYRVTASTGRGYGDAVYDIRLHAGLWAIQQVRDY
ncbi:DUF6504 family protein [Kineosporia succinea]|uniref:DUF6504 domain-containing protein n=1 Tax=Kineosporia succinea TaxID=84632 RepID=A0ABT9P9N8_9ACTN|nr:DUF6504 family protein [Kineosporia succinea]MDP9829403.1 hypothetical protein [Kineosporia succinea]